MDEQSASTREETCPNFVFKTESSYLSEEDSTREHPLSAHQQIQLANHQRNTGRQSLQQVPDVHLPDIERVDRAVDEDVQMKDATFIKTVATEGHLQANENARNNVEFPWNADSSEIVQSDPDERLQTSASVHRVIVDGDEQPDVSSKSMCTPDGQAALGHVDSLRETGASDFSSVGTMMDECRHEEASLEMLSVAVESFENMQKQSEGGLKNIQNLENPEFRKEHVETPIEQVSVNCEKHCGIKSSVTKSTSESEDNESSVIDGASAPIAEFQDKEHILNLLCELAAAHQQERELSSSQNQVTSCVSDNNAVHGKLTRLSFVDLLRKQMVHAGAFTDRTASAIYEEFLRKNQELFDSKIGKGLNQVMPSGGISSNNGAVATFGFKQKLTDTCEMESEEPSTNEIIGESRSEETRDDLSNFADKAESDFKEEMSDDKRRFDVGDLVWAKVKSHPWWPGQIFDAADASVAAKRIQKSSRTLVAFFGDGTFGWLQQSQLIPFVPNFTEKVKQTTMKSFCRAVAEALGEVCRRTELGVRCSHFGDAVYSQTSFPDLNAGIRKGVKLRCHHDIDLSKEKLQPEKVLKFIHIAACAPLYPLSSGLEYSELCGQVYGFRSFLLSSERPKSKASTSNMVKTVKKGKSLQNLVTKRRFELDEPGDGPSSVAGKAAKRLHVSKDTGVEELSAGAVVQSPRFRSMDNSLSLEAEEPKAVESEGMCREQLKGSTWLAKGKRLHVSPDSNEKKRGRVWHSLGPLSESKKSALKTTQDTSTDADDDNKTLLDMTGYHSLKKKKKPILKSTTGVLSEKVDQDPLEIKQDISSRQPLADLIETRGDVQGVLEKGFSSMSMMAAQLDPGSVIEDFRFTEENSKNTEGQMEVQNAEAEISEQVEGERVNECRQDSKQQIKELLDSEGANAEQHEKYEMGLKAGVRDDQAKDEGKLDAGVEDKIKNVVKVDDSEENKKVEGVLSVDSTKSESSLVSAINKVKKPTKRLHSEIGEIERLLAKARKRRQDAQGRGNLQGPLSELEEIVTRKLDKTSKVGASMRKAAGVLKGMPGSPKTAVHIKSKKDLFNPSAEFEVSKPKKKPSDHLLATSQVSSVRGSNGQSSYGSIAKLLSILQEVAVDPISSADMRSSLEGVTSVFLRFRNMVFLKSSGYAGAAAGKFVPSVHNGYVRDKTADENRCSSKKASRSEVQRTCQTDSHFEKKALLKTQSGTGSIVGPQSPRLAVLDTPGEAKAVAIKGDGVPLVNGESILQNSSAASKTSSGEGPVRDATTWTGSQRLGVQELAVAARKKKSEVLQESATKMPGKSQGCKRLSEKLFAGKRVNEEKVGDTRHHAKSVKHYISKSESLSLPDKRSAIQSSGKPKVALGIFMQFPEDCTLPSEAELKEVFNQFGTLENFGVRIYKDASRAQVVFKHTDDAEAAWQHARKNRMFGLANVSYRLRHFSMSKSDSRLFPLAFAQKSSSETRNLKSSEKLGRSSLVRHLISGSEKGVSSAPSHLPARDSFLNRSHSDITASRVAEQAPIDKSVLSSSEPVPVHSLMEDLMVSSTGPATVVDQAPVSMGGPELVVTCSAASGPWPGSSSSPVALGANLSSSSAEPVTSLKIPIAHQEVLQNPSFQDALASNCINPPPVHVSSGDIKDQMLKLLQQVSLIVSSTSLARKSS